MRAHTFRQLIKQKFDACMMTSEKKELIIAVECAQAKPEQVTCDLRFQSALAARSAAAA
jgi:hypothetical protein